MNKTKFNRAQRQQLVSAIRAGIERCKHHQNYTKRVHDVIRAEIVAAIPGCVVFFGANSITVWHTQFCNYDSRFFAIWNWYNGTWPQAIEREMQRCDESDCMEREEQEQAVLLDFIELNRRAEKLVEQLEQVREAGRATILGLPIPTSATCRKSSCHWDSPSAALAAQFPELFPVK